ncbi:MAG: hypothetical protein II926_10475 [Bacteroidales bacterium]|jgi:hypothetical protein|nr:hypothetical protein [Bacteroidales bacterium]
MKKVFLLLASALMGVASFAANTWTFDDENNKIEIDWNEYGDKDATQTSIQWQAGNQGALLDAVNETTGDIAWTPEVGQGFSIKITGVASNTGKLQMSIVDEREVADWYTALSASYPEIQVVKGEPFVLEGVIFLDNVTTSKGGKEVEGGLTAAGLVLAFKYAGTSEDEGFSSADPFTISDATMEIVFAEKVDIENPVTLTYLKKADNSDNYQYQSITKSKVAADGVKAGAYANVTFKGTARADVSTLMYMLADNAQQEDGHYFEQTTAEFVTFAANIKNGDNVKYEFSYPLEKASDPMANEEGKKIADFVDCILAESADKTLALYFENASVEVSVSATAQFDAPKVAVEEVSNVAFENGVIYSSSIVVYNQAGQVVATASDEFAINTLKAGIYFAKTAEGSISFVVK